MMKNCLVQVKGGFFLGLSGSFILLILNIEYMAYVFVLVYLGLRSFIFTY